MIENILFLSGTILLLLSSFSILQNYYFDLDEGTFLAGTDFSLHPKSCIQFHFYFDGILFPDLAIS